MATKKKSATKSVSSGKTYAIIGGYVLMALAIAYLVLANVFGGWNPVAWAKRNSIGDTANADEGKNTVIALDDNGNVYVDGGTYNMPEGLTFVTKAKSGIKKASAAPTTEVTNTIRLTALVEPDNADQKAVTFESSDPDRVECKLVTGYMHDATVRLIQDLTETVTITCRSVDNPEIYAECKIDQLMGFDDIEIKGGIEESPTALKFGDTYTPYATVTKKEGGYGTVLGTLNNVGFNVELTTDFKERIQTRLGYSNITYQITDYDIQLYVAVGNSSATFPATPYEWFLSQTGSGFKDVNPDAFNHAFKTAAKEITDRHHAIMYVTAEYTYKGYVYGISDWEKNLFEMQFDISNIWVNVTSITLNQNTGIFGF